MDDKNENHHHERISTAEDTTYREDIPDPLVPFSLSMSSWVFHRLRKDWKVIALGQGLSFLLASGGAAQATLHLDCGLSAPAFTMALVYLGLSIIHLPILFRRRRQQLLACPRRDAQRLSTHDSDAITHHFGEESVQVSDENDRNIKHDNAHGSDVADSECESDTPKNTLVWSPWWYLLLAFCDVQANAVTNLAFRYTTLTSVTLFDALAIPAAMVISRCVLFRASRRYRALHYIGVLVCMVGVVLNVFQDYESDDAVEEKEYPHKMWGDLCAITGGILFGLNDVLTELTVSKAGDTTEYLGMLGACGFLISFLQSLLFEREEVREFFPGRVGFETCSLQSGFLLLSAFVGVTILSYVGASHFLVISEATFFNLSLLTGDLWSVLFSVVAERIVPQPLFFAALASVLSGVVIYEMAPSPALDKEQQQQQHPQNRVKTNDGIDYGNDGVMVTKDSDDSKLPKYRNDYGNDEDGLELNAIAIT